MLNSRNYIKNGIFITALSGLLYLSSCCFEPKRAVGLDPIVNVSFDTTGVNGFTKADLDTVFVYMAYWYRDTTSQPGKTDTFLYAGNQLFYRLDHGKTYHPENMFLTLTGGLSDSARITVGKYEYRIHGTEQVWDGGEKCSQGRIKNRFIRINGVVGDLEQNSQPAPFFKIQDHNLIFIKP